jgi:hypothetical protein
MRAALTAIGLLATPAACVIALATVAGCGGADRPQPSSDQPTAVDGRPPESFDQARARIRASGAATDPGEVTIRNRSADRIECTIPGYEGARPFPVAAGAGRIVAADDIEGSERKIDEVTCQGKRIGSLGVTPSAVGVGLEYLSDGSFRRTGYVYLHAHLSNLGSCRGGDFGERPQGVCPGTYLAGTPPYDRVAGLSSWEKLGSTPEIGGAGIRVTMAVSGGSAYGPKPGTRIECFIRDRSRSECYTDRRQDGKPAGSEGGPLALDVHMSGGRYVFLRGFCQKDDPRCTPH